MGCAEAAGTVEYLSDLQYLFEHVQQGSGKLGIDAAVTGRGIEPRSLQIGEKHYERGLGHHAPGEIVIDLDGAYSLFEAEVGVQKQPNGLGSVEFVVYVDGRESFRSGVMRTDTPAKALKVDVQGAQELRLVVTDAGDGLDYDRADWADAKLIRSANPTVRAEAEIVDLAPFARVCTWDPERLDGSRATRVDEFHAEDVYTEKELVPDASDDCVVPAGGCIGLQWLESRRIKSLSIKFAGEAPSAEGVKVECWTGESAWQGKWEPLAGKLRVNGSTWTFEIDRKTSAMAAMGTLKTRFIIPSGSGARVRRMGAIAQSRYLATDLFVSFDPPAGEGKGRVSVYNGDVAQSKPALANGEWDLSRPLELNVRYTKPSGVRTDRTVLRFELPSSAFGVAVEDVLAAGSVHVRGCGLTVSAKPGVVKPAGGKTILERVREMPDQTFGQAMAKTHNPIQNNGPMLLSLACDSRKFIAEQNGTLRFSTTPDEIHRLLIRAKTRPCAIQPRFGSNTREDVCRRLEISDLPIIEMTTREGDVVCREVAYVAPLDEEREQGAPAWAAKHPLCIAEYTIENTKNAPAEASLALKILANADENLAAELKSGAGRLTAWNDGQFLAAVDTSETGPLECKVDGGELTVAGTLAAGGSARCRVYMPGWDSTEAEQAKLAGKIDLRQQLAAYWRRVLAPAMQIDIPDDDLEDVIRMQRIHCLMAGRSEDGGKNVAAWIGAVSYGPLESEAHSIIRGMDMLGHDEFARRSLDFFIKRYNEAGFLTTGYTLMGTGWHLWTLGEHFDLTHDTEWVRSVAPEVARVCRWIEKQREKTKAGENMPERGLMPPGVLADWNAFAYYFCLSAYYDAGLAHAGKALEEVGVEEGKAFTKGAREFATDILRAYRWTQARMPVYALKDGSWVRGYPSQVHGPGPTHDFFPGQDGNRSWCYDVELGAHQLVPAGVLDPMGEDVTDMMDHMEDVQFLRSGHGDYPAEKNEADWFNMGGFGKLQPFYCRNAEIYAMRDEVKPFIRSYFNAMASLLNTETLWFWEHFHNIAAWDKTHETGYWLQQTRWMLVQERGDELWLAPFVTNNWLKDGLRISAGNAPTRFGKVSYAISSHVGQGYIEAVVEPPTRSAPREIVVRLRHPEGTAIRSAKVEGAELAGIDAAKEIVRVRPGAGRFVVRAAF